MTPKERMRAALRGEKPDVVPAAPSYIGLFRASAEKRCYVEQYQKRIKGLSRYRLDHDEDVEFRTNAIYRANDMFEEKPDCIEVTPGPARDWAARTEIVVEDSKLWYLDTVTGDRREMLGSPFPSGADYLYGNLPSSDRQDVWDQSELIQNRDVIDMLVRLVSLDELQEQGLFDLPKKVIREHPESFAIVYDSSPYTASYLLGFQGMMLAFHDNPDNLKYFIKRVLKQREPILHGFAEAGYDGIYVEEIFSGADIISPHLYDEFVFPQNAEYFRITRRLGLLTAYYVCGNPVPLFSRIAQLACDAVAFEESKKNFTIEIDEIVEKLGSEKCVFGNIDAPHYGLHVGPAEVQLEVRRQIQAGLKARGFVVSIGSPLPLQTPLANIDAMIAAAHAHKLT